jgi:hypothetical protein
MKKIEVLKGAEFEGKNGGVGRKKLNADRAQKPFPSTL